MAWITPITDRIQADVDNAKAIRANKIQTGGTPTSAEYETLDRGSITHETLNRIENNQAYLKSLLNEAGYWGIPTTNKTDWDTDDILRAEDWQRILDNEDILKAAYFTYMDTPQTLNTLLTYGNLNSVEKILDDLNSMILSMQYYYRQCGTFECGEARS